MNLKFTDWLQAIPVALSAIGYIMQLFHQWKADHPDHPNPVQGFVDHKILNPKIAPTPAPVLPIAAAPLADPKNDVFPVPDSPHTETPEQYTADIQTLDNLAKETPAHE